VGSLRTLSRCVVIMGGRVNSRWLQVPELNLHPHCQDTLRQISLHKLGRSCRIHQGKPTGRRYDGSRVALRGTHPEAEANTRSTTSPRRGCPGGSFASVLAWGGSPGQGATGAPSPDPTSWRATQSGTSPPAWTQRATFAPKEDLQGRRPSWRFQSNLSELISEPPLAAAQHRFLRPCKAHCTVSPNKSISGQSPVSSSDRR
jgi:hypothetical protein